MIRLDIPPFAGAGIAAPSYVTSMTPSGGAGNTAAAIDVANDIAYWLKDGTSGSFFVHKLNLKSATDDEPETIATLEVTGAGSSPESIALDLVNG